MLTYLTISLNVSVYSFVQAVLELDAKNDEEMNEYWAKQQLFSRIAAGEFEEPDDDDASVFSYEE